MVILSPGFSVFHVVMNGRCCATATKQKPTNNKVAHTEAIGIRRRGSILSIVPQSDVKKRNVTIPLLGGETFQGRLNPISLLKINKMLSNLYIYFMFHRIFIVNPSYFHRIL